MRLYLQEGGGVGWRVAGYWRDLDQPRFSSQHPHSGSQPPITLGQGDLVPSSGRCGHRHKSDAHMAMQAKHPYSWGKKKKKFPFGPGSWLTEQNASSSIPSTMKTGHRGFLLWVCAFVQVTSPFLSGSSTWLWRLP